MAQKILVVDDEEDILMMVEVRLEANGYEVIKASNGLEGLEQVKSNRPDLIISDILMPEMDGFAFYKELKKDSSMSDIPVLIMSARGKMEDTFRVMGVDDFVTKPFKPEELLSKIQQRLGQAAPTPAAPAEEPASPSDEKPVEARSEQLKILIGGKTQKVIDSMTNCLGQKKCSVEVAGEENAVIQKAAEFVPDMILLDVLINNQPSSQIIARLRKSREFKSKPIVIYSYLDKESLGDVSVPQRTMDIDRAKTACLDSGATESMGAFEESAFEATIEKYLNS